MQESEEQKVKEPAAPVSGKGKKETKKKRRSGGTDGPGPASFIFGFGVVSMLMDMVYESSRAIQGPLLASLGASAAIVGLVSGIGEVTSFAGRLVTGRAADRSGSYWLFAIFGYAVTAVTVPIMGLFGSVLVVSLLIITERLGKAVRTPSRDAMISHAAKAVGTGKGFAIHELMDQIGSVLGPVAVAAVLALTNDNYAPALGIMAVPGAAAVAVLFVLRHRVPHPEQFETAAAESAEEGTTDGEAKSDVPAAGDAAEDSASRTGRAPARKKAVWHSLPRNFWSYSIFCGLSLAGIATFAVLSYHASRIGVFDDAVIPLLYALAMGVDAAVAFATGILYDRIGLNAMAVLPIIAIFIPFFALGSSAWSILLGVSLWGADMGIQEAAMKAAVSDMVDSHTRATAFGIFSVITGVGTLLGGLVSGALYEISVPTVLIYSLVMELASVFVLMNIRIRDRRER